MEQYFEYIQNISCEINNFLSDTQKRCLWIISSNSKNIQNIVSAIETDYIFTDLFYNIKDETDLLFLIRQQKNPARRPYEYDSFLNPTGIVNIYKIFSAAVNLLKKDTIAISQQIIQELKKINNSRICILIDCEDGIHKRLASILHEICAEDSIDTKFILIGSEQVLNSNTLLRNGKYSQVMYLSFPTEYLRMLFPKFTDVHITSLRVATKDNIQEMIELYEYLIDNIDFNVRSNDLLQDIIETGLQQSYNLEALNIFSVAAHLTEKFTITELEEIINGEMHNNIIAEEIENVLNDGVEKGFVKEIQENIYKFIISIIKNALQNIRKKQACRIHLAIESYLSKKCPFAYELRYSHLLKANSSKIDRIIAMQFFNKLHFDKIMDNETESRFVHIFGESIANTIKKAYCHLKNGDFNAALNEITAIDICENVVIETEIKYLETYLLWKTINKSNAFKILGNKFKDIECLDCEAETRIFSKLLQLSVLTNESDYLYDKSPTPVQLYNEISKLLCKFESVDAQYLFHVLKRKSNCALPRATSISHVRASFEYFSKCKEFYPLEYFYSGTNYTALLIQSITTNEQAPLLKNMEEERDKGICACRDAYTVAKSLKDESYYCNNKIVAYIWNNYLVAKALSSKVVIEEKELEDFAKLIFDVSIDSYIMFNMNLGTLYAMQNDFETAIKYWNIAKEENGNHDAYFNYIFDNNLFIVSLINGDYKKNPPDFIPMLVSNDAEVTTYFNKRNALLKSLQVNSTKFKSLREIENYFNIEFSKKYNNMQLKIWSNPLILSDVQFWSDN